MINLEIIIDIIHVIFRMSQKDIAEKLRCDKTTITKLKRKKYSTPSTLQWINKLHENIFKMHINDGTETPESLLSQLKEGIELSFGDVKEVMITKKYWDESDYDKFVTNLLKIATPPFKRRSGIG